MKPEALSRGAASVVSRVSTLELLFDLVFVFTITQVTEIVVAHPTWPGVAQAAMTLTVVWWMYDGFAWLTNQATRASFVLRFGLIAAMIAFLLLAVAVPDAFGRDGLLFGVAYLVIVCLHFTLFMVHGSPTARRGMFRIGPFNLFGALLLVAAGALSGGVAWVLFGAAIAVFCVSVVSRGQSRFDIGASHFAERHGLLMIIAFGESIVSVGIGATGRVIEAPLIVGASLCVGIVGAMWWCYFSGDDDRAGERMREVAAQKRSFLALTAFGIDHLVMIFGLVIFAAGVKLTIGNVFSIAEPPAAWLLVGGVALYLLGDARFRQELALGPAVFRYTGAAVAAAIGVLGMVAPAAILLAALLVVLVLVIALEWRTRTD